jgi:hypothetical protein
MLRAAIDAYHELLGDDGLAGESQARLDDQLRRRGLFFGDRALCTVLRPRFLDPAQSRFLTRRIAEILAAFHAAYDAAMADERILAQFGLEDWERTLLRAPGGAGDPSPTSRLDAFLVGETGGLRFTEYNAETPAGAAYADVLAEVFQSLPVMRRFARDWEVRPLLARQHVLTSLLDAYDAWARAAGRDPRRAPRVAIVDWREVPTWSEFLLFQDYFARAGLACVLADPRELEYRDGALHAEGGAVDLVYKRVLLSELVGRGGMDQPLVRAVREGAVCMVNPPQCKVLHKKSSLAVLSDERNAHLFTGRQLEAIAAHIPWTRVVEERRTTYDGREVELLPFATEHRAELVLKPHDEYGGKGIVLGWETSAAEWEAALNGALREPHIVQRRVQIPMEPYPSLVDGRVHVLDRMVDTAPYVTHGRYVDGCLTRLGTAALLNVTAGGGSQTPTFVVERR